MSRLEVIRLGNVDGYVMTNAFVVLASSVTGGTRGDTLVLCHADAPFANVGFHQETEMEIDTGYCAARNIPIVRRMVGGGAIADGPWEEDYFLICSLDSAAVTGTLDDYYVSVLRHVSDALERFGIRSVRQGLNDLAVRNRKISANGAVDIGNARVLTGDILLDLDIDTMAGILRVPDAKFRDKIASSMSEHLTSMRNELCYSVPREEVDAALLEEFGGAYEEVAESRLTEREREELQILIRERQSSEWIFMRDGAARRMLSASRMVKINENIFLCRYDYKAQKLIRITVLVEKSHIADILISGDFFTIPVDWCLERLEGALKGVELSADAIISRIEQVLNEERIRIMGATPADIACAILEAANRPIVRSSRG